MTVSETVSLQRVEMDRIRRRLVVPFLVRDGLVAYQNGGHTLLNRILWQGSRAGVSPGDHGRFVAMDDALAFLTSRLTSPGVTVYRGVPSLRGIDLDALEVGDELTMAGYSSSTLKRAQALPFLGKRGTGVMYQLDVPQGLPGGWVAPYGDADWKYQQEYLFPRGCRIVITGINKGGSHPIISGEVQPWP